MTSTRGAFPKDWGAIRRRVLARDGHTCFWCGKPATTVDHLTARKHGGGHEDSNLVAACNPCNASRGGRISKRTKRKQGVRANRCSII